MFQKTFLIGLLVTAFFATANAQEIDDVELGLDEAISESDAAKEESAAMKKQRSEEKERLIRLTQEAEAKQQQANETEIRAKAQIADLDKQIRVLREQQALKKKMIHAANLKIQKQEAALAAKQAEHEREKGKLTAADEAYEAERRRLEDLNAQILQVRQEHAEKRRLFAERKKQYEILKKQRLLKERELASLRAKRVIRKPVAKPATAQ